MLWTVHAFAMGLDEVTSLFERSNLELLRACAEITAVVYGRRCIRLIDPWRSPVVSAV